LPFVSGGRDQAVTFTPGDFATVGFNPPEPAFDTCGTTDVAVRIDDVVELYGADIRLSFDPSRLQVVDANANKPGIQLQPLTAFLSPDFLLLNTADNTSGTAGYAATQLNPRPPATGSGDLLTIQFLGSAPGPAPLTFTKVQLADRYGVEIPAAALDVVASVSAPITPELGIAHGGGEHLALSWSGPPGSYLLFHGSQPYFAPEAPYLQVTARSVEDTSALAQAGNDYFLVRQLCADGLPGAQSNRVGAFTFPLVAGS
jgi:hypothetical protein